MIYFFETIDKSRIKIGYTGYHPDRRLRALQNEQKTMLVPLGYMDGDKSVEKSLHTRFGEHRLDGEWFSSHPEIVGFIKVNASDLGEVHDYSDDEVVTTLRLPKSDYDELRQSALTDNRSINAQAQVLLREALAARPSPTPKRRKPSNV